TPPGEWSAAGKNGAVAAGGAGAVEAGLELLKAGGNAADAAAATILALSVTDSNAFCFGGEVPILVYDAKRGVVEVLCGQGAAPIRRLIDAEKASPTDRRRGLRLVADYFYRGPVAREIDAWSKANGGLIRYTDLATHVTRVEEPAVAEYRGHTVYKCGAWDQG